MTSLIAFFILGGAFFSFVGAVGVIRLPDIYTRLQATTKSATLGVMMTMLGAFFYFWYTEGLIDTQLFLAVLFIFTTAPLGAHMIARSAFHADVEPYKLTILNELKRDETNPEDQIIGDTQRVQVQRKKDEDES